MRFLLGNAGGFDPAAQAVKPADLEEIDRWLLARKERLVAEITAQMEAFQFHRVYQLVHVFCVNDLSAFYLDVQKDVLYCDAADSPRRRSAQTAMAEVADALVRVIAPILVHTAEEIWGYLPPPAQRRARTERPPGPVARRSTRTCSTRTSWPSGTGSRKCGATPTPCWRSSGSASRFDKHTEARVALAVADAAELARLREVGAQRAGRPAAGERTGADDARRGPGRGRRLGRPARRWASSGSPSATLLEQTYQPVRAVLELPADRRPGSSRPTCATDAARPWQSRPGHATFSRCAARHRHVGCVLARTGRYQNDGACKHAPYAKRSDSKQMATTQEVIDLYSKYVIGNYTAAAARCGARRGPVHLGRRRQAVHRPLQRLGRDGRRPLPPAAGRGDRQAGRHS